MSITYSQRFEALLIFDQTTEFSDTATYEEKEQLRIDVDNVIAEAVKNHKTVTLDPHHAQYGWDFNLFATNEQELKAAAREIMDWVYNNPIFRQNELVER